MSGSNTLSWRRAAVAVAASLALAFAAAPPAAADTPPPPPLQLTSLSAQYAVLTADGPEDEGGTGTFTLANAQAISTCDEINLVGTLDGKSLWIQAWFAEGYWTSAASQGKFVFTPNGLAGTHTLRITAVNGCGADHPLQPVSTTFVTRAQTAIAVAKPTATATGKVSLKLSSVSMPRAATASAAKCSLPGISGVCNAGALAQVQAKVKGAWVNVKRVKLGAKGTATLVTRPAVGTTAYRALLSQSADQLAATSSQAKLPFKAVVKAALSAKRAGGKTTVTVKVSKRALSSASFRTFSGAKVSFQVKSGSSWRTVYSTTARAGKASMVTSHKNRSYRVIVKATSTTPRVTTATLRR